MADSALVQHPLVDAFAGTVDELLDWVKWQRGVNDVYRQLCVATGEPDPGPANYVYVLGSKDLRKRQVYIGKTVNLPLRFHAHRSREWWPRVEYAHVMRFDCRGHDTCDATVCDRVLVDWESVLIHGFEPDANRFWPARVPDIAGLL